MKSKKINHNYIQKAFVKNWCDENKNIKYTKYNLNKIEEKTFNYDDYNKNHPISIEYFYSSKIEDDMNVLESDAINVIKKIIDQSKSENLSLYRHEIISLKFYLLLNEVRTLKFRNNIQNRTGNTLFNKIMSEDGRDAKLIQEEYISKIIDYYKSWKSNDCINSNWTKDYEKNYPETYKKKDEINFLQEDSKEQNKDHNNLNKIIFNHVLKVMNLSSLIFIKFSSDTLICSDANSFCEYTNTNEEIYSFYPISPSIGIIVINNFSILFFDGFSKIFKNFLKPLNSIQDYINKDKIYPEIQYLYNYFENNLPKNRISECLFNKFQSEIISLYKNKKDLYKYKFKKESKDVSLICNAMMLIHPANIIIYKNIKDVEDSIKKIKELGIYRLEDIM